MASSVSALDSTSTSDSLLLSVLFLRSEWDAAIYHFEAQLDKKAADFRSIAKLLQVLRLQ